MGPMLRPALSALNSTEPAIAWVLSRQRDGLKHLRSSVLCRDTAWLNFRIRVRGWDARDMCILISSSAIHPCSVLVSMSEDVRIDESGTFLSQAIPFRLLYGLRTLKMCSGHVCMLVSEILSLRVLPTAFSAPRGAPSADSGDSSKVL